MAPTPLNIRAGLLPFMAALMIQVPYAQAAEHVDCNPKPLLLLTGAEVPDLAGADLADLRFMVPAEGGWVALPTQVDERDSKGRYLFETPTDGPGLFGRDDSLPGTLSAEDEILLMPGTPLSNVAPTTLPEGVWYAIGEGGDAQGGGILWGYLGLPEAPIDKPTQDYVHFDAAQHSGTAPGAYTVRYGPDGQSAFPTDLIIPATQNGQVTTVDVLEHTGLSVDLTVRGTDLHFQRNEADIRRELDAYTDGPLRVLLDQRYSVQLLSWLASPSAKVVMKLYPLCVEVPTTIQIPFDPNLVLGQGDARAYFSLNHDPGGSQLELGSMLSPTPVPTEWSDGPMSLGMAESAVLEWEGTGPISLRMAYPKAQWQKLGVANNLTISETQPVLTSAQPTPTRSDAFDLAWNVKSLERLPKGSYKGSLQISIGRLAGEQRAVWVRGVAGQSD